VTSVTGPAPARATTAQAPDRLLAAPSPRLADHLAVHGPAPAGLDRATLTRLAEQAGLTGRGGGGFPTARKIDALAGGARPVVIANGAEGEPASSKDVVLLTRSPHLVIDGAVLLATVVGARDLCFYVPAGPAEQAVRAALRERGRSSLRADVVIAPDTFLAGEESAAASAVAGRAALPESKVRRLTTRGAFGRPTLVSNVETFAHLALIARHGPAWYRAVGEADEPGTRLVTIGGAVRSPGVVEVAGGTPIAAILDRCGGASEPLSAVLVGGYHGGWLPASELNRGLSARALAPWGLAPGAGVLLALPARTCGIQAGAEIATYLAGETSGRCGPCVNGLPAMADTLVALARGRGDKTTAGRLKALSGLVAGRGACHHPDGTVRLVASTLKVFADDVSLHIAGRCQATGRAA
jgi:NADH:ubiquinone oxidoreductase subunit F (NADH-binding)